MERRNFGGKYGAPNETDGDFPASAALGLLRTVCSAAGLVVDRFPEMHGCWAVGQAVDGGMFRTYRRHAHRTYSA